MVLLSENKICEGPESFLNIFGYSFVIWLFAIVIPQLVVFIYIILSGTTFFTFRDDYLFGIKLNRFPILFSLVIIILFTLYKSFVLDVDYQLFKTLKEKKNYNNISAKLLTFFKGNYVKAVLFTILFTLVTYINIKLTKRNHTTYVLINLSILASISVAVVVFLKKKGYHDFTHIIMSSFTTILLSFLLFIVASHLSISKSKQNPTIAITSVLKLDNKNKISAVSLLLISLTIILYQLKSIIYKVLLNQKSYT
tara:strand:- start:1623 stop:2381 length:759 start_codon:yes stop_codon:yes gene_type:complete